MKNDAMRFRFDSRQDAEQAMVENGFTDETHYVHLSTYAISPWVICRFPAVGDEVSYGFNGDRYPDGEIVKVSGTKKVVTTSTGRKYYRSASRPTSWLCAGTWSLIPGHVSTQNPHF